MSAPNLPWDWYSGGPVPNPTPPFRGPEIEAGPVPPTDTDELGRTVERNPLVRLATEKDINVPLESKTAFYPQDERLPSGSFPDQLAFDRGIGPREFVQSKDREGGVFLPIGYSPNARDRNAIATGDLMMLGGERVRPRRQRKRRAVP